MSESKKLCLSNQVGVEAFVSVNSLMECIQKFCDGLIVTKKCEADDSWTVHPSTGYVLKFKQVKSTIAGEKCKFFWNICHCTEVPPPINDYDEDAVSKILDSDDPSRYRIPLSVGELETISDHGQNDSLKTDIIVNSTFFMKRLQKNEFFQHLLLLVSAEAVEKKHGIKVDWTDAIFLKKRSSIGGLKLQRIRKKPANAFIEETRESRIDEKDEAFALENRPPSNCMITLRNGCTVEVLVKFPAECAPIDDVERLSLKANDDCILVILDRRRTLATIFFPFWIDFQEMDVKYDAAKNLLTILVPVLWTRRTRE